MEMLNHLSNLLQSRDSVYIAIAAVALSILYYVISNRRLPPGPVGLPYLGYWPFFSHENCHIDMQKLAKKYGDIFSFTVTGRTFIHLGSYKVAKEAHITKSDCFAERLTGFNILAYYLRDGIVFTDMERWKAMRKFFLQQFRERGMTIIRDAHSGAIYDTVKETVAELRKQKGVPVDIAEMIVNKSNKIMQLTLLGGDAMTEQELQEFCSHYHATLMSMTSKNLMLVGEFARYFLIPFSFYFNEGKKGHVKMQDMLYRMINKRKSTYNENHIRDAIDAFFKERDDRKAKNDPSYKLFTDRCLMVSLIQIIGDGVLFMAMFVTVFIKALLDHPEEQEKIYQELTEVCGVDRDPEMDDKNKLMYTNAFISEVMRTTDIFTVFPSLECSKETTVCGYRIPKGAITVYNFYAAHMNPNDYDEPEKFNPSRFMAEKGKRPDLLTLFGIGKRSCIGEGFAMNQVFLFLTILVKNFRFSKPPGVTDMQTLFFASDKINVIVEPRRHK